MLANGKVKDMTREFMPKINEVKRLIKDYVIAQDFHTLFLAVSGGLDSVALLNLCVEIKEEAQTAEGALTDLTINVLHYNHKLRGLDSEADERAVRKICDKHGLSLVVASGDVYHLAEKEGLSLELAARKARYSFFQREMKKVCGQRLNGAALCTAHHLYDQSESILLHLFRGSGLSGLEGMKILDYFPDFGIFVFRPLLGLSKDNLIAYADDRKLYWREDASNQETDFTRNFLRLDILPQIRERINEKVDVSLERLSEIAQAENAYFDDVIEHLHDQWTNEIAKKSFPSKRNAHYLCAQLINREDFLAESVAIQRRYLRFFLYEILKLEGELSFQDIEEVRELFLLKANKKKVLYDIIVLSDYESLLFYRKRDDHSTKKEEKMITLPSKEGESVIFSWPKLGMEFSIYLCSLDPISDKINPSKAYCTLTADGVEKLKITTYQGGEEFSQIGGGTKPLRRCFNDWKLSTELRQDWPIFSANDQIVWLPGLGRSDVRLLEAKGQVYIIELVNPMELTWSRRMNKGKYR